MSTEQQDAIFIRAASSNNGITSVVIGLAIVIVGILVISLLPKVMLLAGIFIVSAGIVGILIGFFKIREPAFSLEITKNNIIYHHRKGIWKVDWNNIQRVGQPRVTRGLETKELEMIGFKLKNSEVFLNQISPRLVTHLLMEQRPLVMQNANTGCDKGKCYGDDLIEDEVFKMNDGEVIKGVKAMFAHRMLKLRERLGYDIFISTNELDRSAHAFLTLIKSCQETIVQQPESEKSLPN